MTLPFADRMTTISRPSRRFVVGQYAANVSGASDFCRSRRKPPRPAGFADSSWARWPQGNRCTCCPTTKPATFERRWLFEPVTADAGRAAEVCSVLPHSEPNTQSGERGRPIRERQIPAEPLTQQSHTTTSAAPKGSAPGRVCFLWLLSFQTKESDSQPPKGDVKQAVGFKRQSGKHQPPQAKPETGFWPKAPTPQKKPQKTKRRVNHPRPSVQLPHQSLKPPHPPAASAAVPATAPVPPASCVGR